MKLIHTGATRRRLLHSARRAPAWLDRGARVAAFRRGAKLARRRPVQPRGRVRRAAPRRLCAVDAACARPLSANPQTPGGMSGGDVTVGYEIATDRRHGECRAARRRRPPNRPSPIRCISMSAACSPAGRIGIASRAATRRAAVGRAITLPAPGAAPDRLRFGFVSCSNYEHGYFSAYRHLADENPEFVLFSRRLYLRDHRGKAADRAPPLRRHRSRDAADLSQSLCAISARSGSGAPARRSAGAGHLGRSRGGRTTMPTNGRNISTIRNCS